MERSLPMVSSNTRRRVIIVPSPAVVTEDLQPNPVHPGQALPEHIINTRHTYLVLAFIPNISCIPYLIGGILHFQGQLIEIVVVVEILVRARVVTQVFVSQTSFRRQIVPRQVCVEKIDQSIVASVPCCWSVGGHSMYTGLRYAWRGSVATLLSNYLPEFLA